MKTVAKVLKVSRSNLYDRLTAKKCKRGRYSKAEDTTLAEEVRQVVDMRPTYGYRRVTSLVNKERQARGLLPVNHKRVFRIMALQGWLLQKHTARPTGRAHDGKVIVMRSNLRWCSDGFEIACWNGEAVRVVFVINAFDREVIGWDAVANQGISGCMVRDLMLYAVEQRLGCLNARLLTEFLSDNGSCYTAKETLDFALSIGLKSRFTPVRSPESNGLAESFVKTFKRDYVRINPLPDAHSVLKVMYGWFDDYNENHPHSGLGWKSPRDFIKAQILTRQGVRSN